MLYPQLEVNPLAETPEGKIYTADAKLGFDDNAKYRQKDIFDMEDTTESDPREVEAERFNLNYVQVLIRCKRHALRGLSFRAI